MTNFILRDGTIIDHGQEWEIDLLTGTYVLTINALFPRTELIVFSVEGIIRDLMWSTFSEGYYNGTVRRKGIIEPKKKLSPHSFV
jgi:hypothetical protein